MPKVGGTGYKDRRVDTGRWLGGDRVQGRGDWSTKIGGWRGDRIDG